MAALGVILVLILSVCGTVFGNSNNSILQQKGCIATATQHGSCHTCICATTGVYHCRATPCNNQTVTTDQQDLECEPNLMYREDTIICTCSSDGQWRSSTCREHFHRIRLDTNNLNKVGISTSFQCKPNKFYVLSCNICICGSDGLINLAQCTNRRCIHREKSAQCNPGDFIKTANQLCACSDIGFFIDRLCVNVKNTFTQQIDSLLLDKIIDIGKDWINATRTRRSLPQIRDGEACTPGKMYKLDCNTCKCTDSGGLMCTKMACLDWTIYKSRGRKTLRNQAPNKLKVKYLPKLPKGPCKPGKLYRSGCRRCFCNDKQKILCSNKKNDACIFDKQGNPFPIRTPEDVSSSFSLALRENIQKLSSASEKCQPGKTYKVDCNSCICMASNDLVCQMKLCISYDDMNRLGAKDMSGHSCTSGQEEQLSSKCIKCRCVGGTSQCAAVSGCTPQLTQKLSSDLQIKNEIFVPYEKCVPDTVYTVNCNKCYCQTDGSLRCTQKSCLNYSQISTLQKKREYLEKHGL